MKNRLVILFVVMVLFVCSIPAFSLSTPETLLAANTAGTIGADITAPANTAVSIYSNLDETTADSFMMGYSQPDSLAAARAEFASRYEAGTASELTISLEIDYKLNEGGSWQYTSAWDELDGAAPLYYSIVEEAKNDTAYFNPASMTAIPNAGSYALLDKNTIYFRCRFVLKYNDTKSGVTYKNISPWSNISLLGAAASKAAIKLDTPSITSAVLKTDETGKPYFSYKVTLPESVKAIDNGIGTVFICTDYKINDGEWKQGPYNHYLSTDEVVLKPESNALDSDIIRIDAGTYQIRTRFGYDEDLNGTMEVFSDFSNIITIATTAYSNASAWAKTELDKASGYGLIPTSLIGADMTKPITREEFAEVAVKLYEKIKGETAAPVSPNPFTDTTNNEILKAFNLGITAGTSKTTFSPSSLTNREQVATFLSRTIRAMVPTADFSTEGAPVFSDQNKISSWAQEHVKLMSKLGIIKGTDGRFMPKATTVAEIAAGYATTTREQAIAMSVRSYEVYK
ncbi:MAG: hypothetical protein HGA22_06615 [Clostridiales bacterium]|nr:hypothetical protein [Clostridiales bacterium]